MKATRTSILLLLVVLPFMPGMTSSPRAEEFTCAHTDSILVYQTSGTTLEYGDALEFQGCTILGFAPYECNQSMTHEYDMGRPWACGGCLDEDPVVMVGDSDVADSFSQYDNFVVTRDFDNGCYYINCCGERCRGGDQIDCD